jgi:hypothetical protein
MECAEKPYSDRKSETWRTKRAVVAEIRNAGGRAEKVGADLWQADGPHILAKWVCAIVGEERLHTENRTSSLSIRSRNWLQGPTGPWPTPGSAMSRGLPCSASNPIPSRSSQT